MMIIVISATITPLSSPSHVIIITMIIAIILPHTITIVNSSHILTEITIIILPILSLSLLPLSYHYNAFRRYPPPFFIINSIHFIIYMITDIRLPPFYYHKQIIIITIATISSIQVWTFSQSNPTSSFVCNWFFQASILSRRHPEVRQRFDKPSLSIF